MLSNDEFYQKAFSRNIGIFSREEQQKIKRIKIAIAGMGGVGSNYLLTLARLGVENFSIADFDSYEIANINRQAGAFNSSCGKKKCDIMEKMAKDINPHAKIDVFLEGIKSDNIDKFLEDVDIVLDGLDFFAIKARQLLFRKAREKNIFTIISAPVGFGASLLVFDPQGMSFEEYFDIHENMSREERILQFALGISPALLQRKYFRPASIDFSKHSAPSLGSGPLACSSMVCAEVMKIVLGKKIKPIPFVSQFDPFVAKYKKNHLYWGNRGLWQKVKIWYIKKFLLKDKTL